MESGANIKRKREDDSTGRGHLQQKRIKLLESRQQLPIWHRQKGIRDALREHNVLILSGETGSGKSTQIPQFLLDQPWCRSKKIAVTQPRRVAAISLARRVAEEMGTPLGSSSPASKVGYSVRFDESTSPSTRIKFLTEGMLLQEMLRDKALSQYSCVVVDEVHERSVNIDLILGFLRQLQQTRRKDLKVVVMSATADVDSLRRFFAAKLSMPEEAPPTDEQPGGADDESWDGFSENDQLETTDIATCHVEGRQYPVVTQYLDNPTDDVIEAALHRIFQIHCKEPTPGDVLVFMTGQETIQALQKLIEDLAQGLTTDYPKMLVLPLFAALPQAAQQLIFQPPPRNTRKIILTTNIAETSVTVPGVKYVVDTGKAKVKQFRNRLGLDSLLVKPISQSSADQRKGRAGREAAGQCYRLYTEASYKTLDKDNKPEILRCDLSQAVLTMKARGVDDVLDFPFLTPPPQEAMGKALLQLLQLNALAEDGKISTVGRKIARLPLTPALGRVILEAATSDMDCLLEVIDIVACLSVEHIFTAVDTEEGREKAQIARSQLLRREGDHLTYLAAVQAYAEEQSDRRRWANEHMISHRAMQSVMDVRKQLTAQCRQAKLLLQDQEVRAATDEATQERILKCFLRGYSTKVARLCPDGSYKTFTGNQTVAIHPSSVLFGRKKVEAILYNQFVYTNKAYARDVSVVQLRWLEEMLQ
ncbi:Salivary acidic proline-rich phosphoprotein 1/2 [Elasticomyces elasticus]|nr:Salivary acidic proline-rich phosphoprotein 1/2 [Elasticomyces elasticus]KAK3643549.1 Salivary acidic proline-rich phosphoprotein 1/2 [Elasticomyces elasticus]KAK4915057.1 Salivary acidic proline-rich phosphoprotein 1/2 [Elasticomyces elasticus]KAK5751091.1 Salivary acidic proline-rich phosphoprotein 1/2 [Elasticomyces elasticus]